MYLSYLISIKLGKDIFIIILKCGKYLQDIEQFHTFYHENLYNYLKSINIL